MPAPGSLAELRPQNVNLFRNTRECWSPIPLLDGKYWPAWCHPQSHNAIQGAYRGQNTFVDDSIFIVSSSNPAIISKKLSSHCRDIADYMAANKFVINADKTHLMAMASNRLAGHRNQVKIVAGDFTIRPSESQKLLGINLQQSMNWNHQIKDGK